MKKIFATLITVCICFCGLCACRTAENRTAENKTREEWKSEYVLRDYVPNNEISGKYNKSLAAKCINGIFVGQLEGNVKIWRGIPYAKQPVGELRFRAPQAPDASDCVYEAYHFMKSGMQSISLEEISSMYEQGEDCLGLNVWSNRKGPKNKAVFVFIHGGGWIAGGTSDPLYNGYYLAENNPDILVVTVDYRLGMLGQIDLSSFPDGKDYAGSEALCMLDMVQSLKWIKENISAFGGNPDNITVCGESAGAGAVSMLCVMPEAKGLFDKAIPMSGSVAQFNDISMTVDQVSALKEEFGCKTVADLQDIPFEELKKWWSINVEYVYHHPIWGNNVIAQDPLDAWKRGDSSDVIVLQGHTADEFRYYRVVFANIDEMFDAACEGTAKHILENSGSGYAEDYKTYLDVLSRLGYSGISTYWEFMDDHAFNSGNIYQAEMHARNGGKGYFYTFEKKYDGSYASLGAAHAVDCYYLFGTFDGNGALGTPDEVEFSRKFQKMIVDFCKTGIPSICGIEWPEYDSQSRYRMMISEHSHVEKNPEGERVDAVMQMMEHSDLFRFTGTENTMIKCAKSINPQAVEKFFEFFYSYQN